MGSPPSDLPDLGFPAPVSHDDRPARGVSRPPSWTQSWRHLLLLLLTAVSTYYANGGGFAYSASILAILGAHEMGHYLACRYYRIDASLPYFLPMPLVLTGTLGAFIRIRERIPGKRELFDVGIAGPIAGFIVALPILWIGVNLSEVIPLEGGGLWLGEPLLFKLAIWLTHGTLAEGFTLSTHPMAFAAWFGLLATALNLFPIGQLDGGHIAYAVLGRRSTYVTFATVLAVVGLTFVSSSWIVWAVLMIVMLFAFGPHHPQTVDEDVPLDRGRIWLAAFALVMFIVCFTPSPIEPLDIVAEPATDPRSAELLDMWLPALAGRPTTR